MSNSRYPDLLYILGSGSRWDDNEIRFSLRSAVENFPFNDVVVVGERPPWMQGVAHIPHPDNHRSPAKNTMEKLEVALQSVDLGKHFVLMNDDFFFLKPHDRCPLVHKGPMMDYVTAHTRTWHGMVTRATAKRCLRVTENPLMYDCHHPMMMVRELARDLMRQRKGRAVLFNSWYANTFCSGGERVRDFKMRRKWVVPAAETRFLSVDDGIALNPDFQRWLCALFPVMSKYETEPYFRTN